MENIKWLWGVMDKRYHKWHILGLIISAVTSLMLLINPYLTMRLMDDVIVAQNPEPLVGLLLTMLIVKVVREGLRYLMVVLLEHSSQNTLMNLRTRLFTRLQYQDMRFFETIYTVLIFADIALVLISQRYMPSFHAVFRNSGGRQHRHVRVVVDLPVLGELEARAGNGLRHAAADDYHESVLQGRAADVRGHARQDERHEREGAGEHCGKPRGEGVCA